MPIYAEYNDQNIVFAVTESAQAPVGNFIEADSFDVIGWVKNGNDLEAPAVVQQYKTKGLSKTEYRSLLTATEALRNDKARSCIDGDMSWLSGGLVGIDDVISAQSFPLLSDLAGFTFRDVLRTAYKAYDDSEVSGGIDIDYPATVMAVNVQALLGLLDSPARKDVILLGKPL